MKKKILTLFALVFALLLLTACNSNPTKYTVSFDGNGAVSTPDAVEVEDGKTLSMPESPVKIGHDFLGWYNGEVKWNFDTDTVIGNLTLTAKWERTTYTVTFDTDGAGAVASQSVKYGDLVTLPSPAPEKAGFEFEGWHCDGDIWNFDNDTVTSDITLSAMWKPYYTVSFDTLGGSAVAPQTLLLGSKITEPSIPTKADCEFLYWSYDGTPWDFENGTVIDNITLIAVWDTRFTVSFDTAGGSAVAPQILLPGSKVTAPTPAPTKANYAFVGWTYNGEAWNFSTDVVTSSITLTAVWKPTYTVSFDSLGGTPIDSVITIEGGKITVPAPAPTKSRYKFGGWYYAGEAWDFENDTVTGNITLTAKWNAPVTVTFDTDGAGEISPITTLYEGDLIPVPQTPNKGDKYRLIGWYVGEKKWNFETDVLTGDVTLTARWGIYTPPVII